MPTEFAARMESIREDYPDAAYYSLMNLLDSHDTAAAQDVVGLGLQMPVRLERLAFQHPGDAQCEVCAVVSVGALQRLPGHV